MNKQESKFSSKLDDLDTRLSSLEKEIEFLLKEYLITSAKLSSRLTALSRRNLFLSCLFIFVFLGLLYALK